MGKHTSIKREAYTKRLASYFLLFVMIILTTNAIYGQDTPISVEGKIVDASSKEPLIGVTITVKGHPKLGTATDIDGFYRINVPNKDVTLQFSYLGFYKKEIKLNGRTILNIEMTEDVKQLNTVEVVAYGQQKKLTVTGAISSIGGEDLVKVPTASVSNMLAGRLSGVSSIQYSGEPGADMAELYVRGITTLNNSSPLIQVDGVERDFSQIDPNEIASITILKDASATAVFGVRGANGVILITTKRGEKGKAKISASTSFGIVKPTKLLKFADSYEWATFYNEAQYYDSGNTLTEDQLRFKPAMLKAFQTGSDPILYPNVNWMDYMLEKQAFQSQHNINISGGTDNMRYFISLGMFTQDGLFKVFSNTDSNFKYNRYNYRANIDIDLTKTTSLALNIGGRMDSKNTPRSRTNVDELWRDIYRATPFSGAGIIDGKRYLSTNEVMGGAAIGTDGLDYYYGQGYSKRTVNLLTVDAILKQKLDVVTKGLSFRIKGSYNTDYSQTKVRATSKPYYAPHMNDPNDPSKGYVIERFGDEGEVGYSESYGNARNWYAEAAFDYSRSFGDHNVGAMLLYNQSKKYYPNDKNGNLYQGIPMGYVSYVGRVTYDYMHKYMFEFNIGHNGSENFRSGLRYGTFPAGSLGWIVTEEKFSKLIKPYISYFKLRASLGKVGNDKMGSDGDGYYRFLYLPDGFQSGGGYNFGTNVSGNKSGFYEAALGNPDITWETAFKQNYGIDAYFLDDHLQLTWDIYKEKRKDILIEPQTIPGAIGISTPPRLNKGKVDSHGYELTLGWNDRINNGFRYWVKANLSFSRNEVIDKDEVKQDYDYLYQTGKPVGARIIHKFWGFYDPATSNEKYKAQFGKDIPYHVEGGLKAGDAVYVDINGDGVIDNNDRIHQGYTNLPEYTYGINLGFEWKGFDLSMQWTGAWNTSRLLEDVFREPLGDSNSRGLVLDQFKRRWTPENKDNARWPRPSLTEKRNNIRESDLYLINAKYLRLKSLEIGYSFRMPFMKKLRMENLRVYANGYNLLTFDDFDFGDPESKTSSRPAYPLTRSFTFGLKVGF